MFRRRHFFQGRPIKGADVKDVLWLNPGGNEMTEEDWRNPSVQSLGMFLSGQGLDETDERGRKVSDTDFLRASEPEPRGRGIHLAGVSPNLSMDGVDGHLSREWSYVPPTLMTPVLRIPCRHAPWSC